MRCFVFQERKHGLVAAVDTVKITNRQGALCGPVGVVKAAKYFHVACVLNWNSMDSIVTHLKCMKKPPRGRFLDGAKPCNDMAMAGCIP
jgi:hypothetical protein